MIILYVSENYMPFEVSAEEEKIPAESGIKILQKHMPEITVPYLLFYYLIILFILMNRKI